MHVAVVVDVVNRECRPELHRQAAARAGAADLLAPFLVGEAYKGWLDAGGSSVGNVTSGKPLRTGFRGAAKALPSAVGIPSATYPKRGTGFDFSDIAQ
jgi:hypothetical protein